jgi:hypothetical protein
LKSLYNRGKKICYGGSGSDNDGNGGFAGFCKALRIKAESSLVKVYQAIFFSQRLYGKSKGSRAGSGGNAKMGYPLLDEAINEQMRSLVIKSSKVVHNVQ